MKPKKKVVKARGVKTTTKKIKANQSVYIYYPLSIYERESYGSGTDDLIKHYAKKFKGKVGGSGVCFFGKGERDVSVYFTWQNDLNKFVKFMKTKKRFTNREPIKGNVPTKFKVKVYDND